MSNKKPPKTCPVCGGEHITFNGNRHEDGIYYDYMMCDNGACASTWTELYRFSEAIVTRGACKRCRHYVLGYGDDTLLVQGDGSYYCRDCHESLETSQ